MRVKCAVCGELWDFYGTRQGEMEQWEYRLFRMGAGCPRCKGKNYGAPGKDQPQWKKPNFI